MAAYQDAVAPHKDWPATVMAVDCTGQITVLGSRKGLAFIDLNTPNTIKKKVTRNSKWECGAVEWNPHLSHAHIFANASNQKTEIWAWRDGNGLQQHILRGHTRSISDLNWSWFDPQLLSTCSMDQFIYIWDLRDWKKPASSLQTNVGASQVKWNRVNRHVLATSHDGDVRIWDLRKGNTPVVYVTAHSSKIHGLDWSRSSGTTLATCSNDSTVKLWNTENTRQPENKLNANSPVWRARFTPFGEGLVTVTVPQLRRGENSLSLWNILDINSPMPVNTFVGHTDVVLEFQWRSQVMNDEEQFQLVTWAKDNTLRLWAIEPRMIMACSGDVTDNFPSQSTSETSLSKRDDLLESAISDSVIINSAEVMPDLAVQPHTLQQEFALINVNIPNVIVEQMDAGHRSCTVNVTNGLNVVSLVINFPPHYPNNAIPSFEFTPDTSIDVNTKTKLMKTLRETAQTHVKLNQTCLEPCLRQLVSHLEELTLQEDLPMDHYTSTVPQIHGRLDPISYGSYLDAAIPFPRTSGAKFCACGLLVCFNLPGRYSGRVGSGGEPTPRSLSAFSAYSSRPSSGPALPPLINSSLQKSHHRHTFSSFGQQSSSRTMLYRTLSQGQQEDLQEGQKYSGVTSRSSDVGLVVIRDVSVMMPIHQSLGQAYTLEGNDITEICKKNLAAAMTTGRKDLVQTWSLLSLVLDKKLAPSDSMDESPWALHPFGRKMVSSLMDYYLSIRDIQMLGMLSCVLAHPSLPDSFKPPKLQSKPDVIISSKSFTYGSSPHCAEVPYQSIKRPKSLGNVTEHTPADLSPADDQWSEISFPFSGGWSPPVFIRAKDPREEHRKQYEKDCRFVDISKLPLHDHYMKQYADVLYRWNLLGKRAEVIKFLSEPQQPHNGVEFKTRCHNCPETFRGAQCWSCRSLGLQCVICHVAVRGSGADEKPVARQSAVLKANKKRKSASDVFAKFDKAFEAFVDYQQAADKSFLEAEAARERREEERAEKRRKEDQEFLLKLAQVLHK